MRPCGEESRRRADVDRHQVFAVALIDHSFGLLDQLAKTRLARDPFRIELFRRRARHDADDIGAPLAALVNNRFDRAEAMTEQNKAPIMMPLEKFDGTVEILDAVVEILIGGAAEFGQIAGTRDPVMAARIDDKTVVATSSQFLAKVKQRRQVE